MKATIEEILDEFLAAREKKLKPRTMVYYRDVVELLKNYLNSYAYEDLSGEEIRLFERLNQSGGEDSQTFCRLFGPEKIVENLGMFLDYFLVRKVIAGADFLRKAGSVTSRLMKWLGEEGYITAQDAREGGERGREAASNLPRAEKAGRLLYGAIAASGIDVNRIPEEDYRDFDHYTISRLEPGKLWFGETYPVRSGKLGPVMVPEAATALLAEGWDISCSFARVKGEWRMVEFGNVYPL
jgi:hypothetical protein